MNCKLNYYALCYIPDVLEDTEHSNGPTQNSKKMNIKHEPVFDSQAANLAALALYDERDLFLGRTYSFPIIHKIFNHPC